MIKKEGIIKSTLRYAFSTLTSDVSDFVELFGFKTAEIKIPSLIKTIGVGFHEPSSTMKIFYIDDQYTQNSDRRFKPVLKIAYRNLGDVAVWDLEFVDETTIIAQVGNFQLAVSNMQAINYVMHVIKEEEYLTLKQ